jgi:hypothetical protein
MNSCVLFSCTITKHSRLHVLREFIEALSRNFKNSDVFVGINYNSLPETENILKSSGLKIKGIERASEELYTESDASAYQAALRLLKKSRYTYDFYWFVHTKSGVNKHSDSLKKWYIHNLLSKKENIEEFLKAMPEVGSYGLLGVEYDKNKVYLEKDCEIKLIENELSKELPYTHANFFYLHTIYVLTKNPLSRFFELTTQEWFNTKLDRYYFEGIFPFIVSRTGYFPYVENRYSCNSKDLSTYINEWIEENNLEHYKKFYNLFKTDFYFHQLNPPYVNSNSKS